MSRIVAQMTTSVDGYYTGPHDGPGRGLGEGGERLHYWVFGGPWSYDEDPRGTPHEDDQRLLDEANANVGAVIAGRWTYESAGAWGGQNPFGVPFFILTHRPDEQPGDGEFRFVDGLENAIEQASEAAGGRDVSLMGGDVIRQALTNGLVDELAISVAPVILGSGKALFDGYRDDVELEQIDVIQSPWATHLRYRVVHAGS